MSDLSEKKKHPLSRTRKYLFLLLIFSFFVFCTSFTPLAMAQSPGDIEGAATEAARAANNFVPLVGIPYIDTTDSNTTMGDFVNALYYASISIAAFLAVVKIIFAGVKYMLSDVVTEKGAAKKDIKGALLGLLIVIGAVLVLNTINPQLTNLDALNLNPLNIELRNESFLSPIDKQCAEYGENNCIQSSCQYMNTLSNTADSLVGQAFYKFLNEFNDWVVNQPACAVTCTFRGGEVISNTYNGEEFCVYPADWEKYLEEGPVTDVVKVGSILDECGATPRQRANFDNQCARWEFVLTGPDSGTLQCPMRECVKLR